ncbi:hypothetical protein HF1_11200 [Mycoplasma haemofelis str. Langford 1]|uniref:Uncharacterized protein n=1 Tax=Mycoplasma haemofelis (strain Langford 1) TaxID=941640 RepID=E8ZJ07_MYCHL|nr:hypothetical protein [Mycoplasma haemofelis]CBY93128.1 hypothetical protein HF1_11200 [Mycoplasma haemofelis str. Langford 1]
MALSTAAKSALGIGTVGGVAGSAIGTNYLLNKDPSIPELIKSKNPEKRLLDKNSSAEAWKAAWKAYREANKNKEKDIWSIEGWTKGNPATDEAAPEAFKKGCESKIAGSSELYDEVVLYCTRKTVLADLVGDDSKRKLLTKVEGGNTAEWKAVWEEYKKSGTTHNGSGDDAWKLTDWTSVSSKPEAANTFMDKCKANSETEGYDTSVSLYQQLLKYCTTEIKE